MKNLNLNFPKQNNHWVLINPVNQLKIFSVNLGKLKIGPSSLSSMALSRSHPAFTFYPCVCISFTLASGNSNTVLPLLARQFFLISNAKLFPSYSFLTASLRYCGSYASLKVAYHTRGNWYLPILKCKHPYSIEYSGVYFVLFLGVSIIGKITNPEKENMHVDSVTDGIWQQIYIFLCLLYWEATFYYQFRENSQLILDQCPKQQLLWNSSNTVNSPKIQLGSLDTCWCKWWFFRW